jgi:hypothetical protein
MRRARLPRSITRRRVAQRFRLLWTGAALYSDGKVGSVAQALEWAYDEVQRQLPRSASRLSPDDVEHLVEDSIAFAARMSVMNLDVQRPAALEHDDAMCRHVAEEVRASWGDAIDELRLLRWVAFEEARDFHRDVPDGSALRQVLLRLHARAMTVTDEVLSLLSAGLASGALARWRTLHELAVTAAFVGEHGEPTAERYLAHRAVTRYRHGLEYQRQLENSGEPPLSEADLEANKRARDTVVAQFGPAFKHEYGWAADALGKDRPTFREIEDAARHGHLRPYYQYASGRVHAGAHGLLLEIADGDERALITGAWASGLTDPLQLTALSLRGVTAELLMAGPRGSGMRGRIVLELLERVYQRIGEALPEARRDKVENASPSLLPRDRVAGDEPGERPLGAWPALPREDVRKMLGEAISQSGACRGHLLRRFTRNRRRLRPY